MSDTPSYDPTPQPPAPSSGGLPPALANISGGTLLWAQVGGGLLAVISVFLPWYSIPGIELLGQRYGGASFNGFDKSGFFGTVLLLLGLAVAALAFIKVRNIQVQGLEKMPSYLPAALAGALGLIALIEFIDVMSDVSGVDGVNGGIGIWLTLVAGLVTVAAAGLPVVKARKA